MIESPYDGRAKLDFDGLEFRISIPTRKNWFIIIFFCAWIGGWFMGETSALNTFSPSKNNAIDGFLIFWLIGWTLGGLFAITILLWTLFGKEKIVIGNSLLIIEKGLLNFGIIKKQYELNLVKNLELNPMPSVSGFFGQSRNIGDYTGFSGGKLRFDYGMKTIKFGVNIDEAEARFILDEIKKKGFYKDK